MAVIKHSGTQTHRLKFNQMERKYARAWKEQNNSAHTLSYILASGENPNGDMTQRDATVAATVIQWLGSPVGQDFVNGVLKV